MLSMRRTGSATALLLVLLAGGRPGGAQTPVPVEADTALEHTSVRWMNYLQDGHFDSAAAHVSPQVIDRMGRAQLAELWPQITTQVGAMKDLEPEDQAELNGMRLVRMAGTFDAGVFDVTVVFGADGKVMGFSVRPPGGGGGR